MFNNLTKIINVKFDHPEEKVRNIVLIFLFIIWFINPTSRILFFFLLVLLGILSYITKKLDISIILVFFLSSFFSVGKKYFVQLINLDQFPHLIDLYPLGLVIPIQILVRDVFFALLVVYSIVAYHRKIKLSKITFIDTSLIVFSVYGIFADIFISNNVYLSLLLKKGLFEYIFMYFVIRHIIKDHSSFFKLFFAIIIPLTLFESFICLQQFILSSPVGRSLEATFQIESFGQGTDELYFVFRPIGTFIHANVFAMFLAVVLPFIAYSIKKSKEFFLKIVFFLALISLVLTLSRTAWLGSLISFLAISLHLGYQKKIIHLKSFSIKKAVFGLFLIIPLLFYSAPRIAKISDVFHDGGGFDLRVRQTNEVIGLISQSPLFGTGNGMSVVKAMEKNPDGVFAFFPSEIHNYFLLQAVENGIPSLGLLIIFLFFSFKKLIGYKKGLSFISLVGLSTMMIVALFQPFILGQFLFVLLAVDYDRIS